MFEKEINNEKKEKTILIYYEKYEDGIEIGISNYVKGKKKHITFKKKGNIWYQKKEEGVKPIKKITKNNTILLMELLNGKNIEKNEKIYNSNDEEIKENMSDEEDEYYYSTDDEHYIESRINDNLTSIADVCDRD